MRVLRARADGGGVQTAIHEESKMKMSDVTARFVLSTAAAAAVSAAAAGDFVGFVVTVQEVAVAGQTLRVHTLWARFNGPTDTVLNAFNFAAVGGSSLTGFWHKDNAYYNSGVIMQEYGTWAPSQTGSITLNRPFDSYLTIGGLATPTNGTNADPSWNSGGSGAGAGDARSWTRPDIPNNGTSGWFCSNCGVQGRVGSAGNTATDVRLGQFALSPGHDTRTYSLTIAYNNGIAGSPVQFGTGTFSLECLPVVTFYRDVDGDGIGAAQDGSVLSCSAPAGYVATNGDNCPSIANPDQADCNSNGVGDVCDIAAGFSIDCDGDLRPDDCEGATVVRRSTALLPLSGTAAAEATFAALPRAYARTPRLIVEATADLGAASDGLLLSVDGAAAGTYFVVDGSDCPATPDVATLTYTLANFNSLVADGSLVVRATAFGAVNSANCAAGGGVRFRLEYDGLPAESDCNGNGQLDSCEIGTGSQRDCNANGTLDSCELAAGDASDCNSNGLLDSCELAAGTSTDLDGNGVLDGCAGEWIVGGSGFATIQSAVQAAPSGATIRVAPGVHAPVDLSGKSITIQSLAGSAQTAIDGGGSQRCITMESPAPGATVVIGFTIRNGRAVDGAGIRVAGASLSLRDSVVRANIASGSGGGIAVSNGSLVVVNCAIEDNSANRGGGLFVERVGAPSSGVIRDTAVARNSSVQAGGGVHNRGQLTLLRCTVLENLSTEGVGGVWTNSGPGVATLLSDSVFCLNEPSNIGGPFEDDPKAPLTRFGQDCNGDGICDLLQPPADCNANGQYDACDIADGLAEDCNENGVPDSCDIASGTSADVDSNGVPDDCKPDCDGDGLPDAWEIQTGLARDCDSDGVPDNCEITQDPSKDKNTNGKLDACELARGDLNLDGIVNASDLAILLNFWSFVNPPVGDLNGDGVVNAADLANMLNAWGTTG